MWSLKKRAGKDCTAVLDHIDDNVAIGNVVLTLESALKTLTPELRLHVLSCEECRSAVQETIEARALLQTLPSNAEVDRPFFSAKVMSAITAREAELGSPIATWIAVPKFAARLTWATSIILLLASTWLMQKPVMAPTRQPSAASAPETLFETSQLPNDHDDILLSQVERRNE